MKYVILIYGNPASREIWNQLSDAEHAEGYAVYAALDKDLVDSGEMIVSEALTTRRWPPGSPCGRAGPPPPAAGGDRRGAR